MSRLVRAIRDHPWSLALAPPAAAQVMRALHRTLRVTHRGRGRPEAYWARGESVILAFWHARLLMMPFIYPGRPAAILISQHRDAEYITRIAERLGYAVVRGSATRGGPGAFKRMIQALRHGQNVAITPDGPKGPRQRAKLGALELARLTGAPLFPVAFGALPAWALASWDRFLIPRPFARACYIWGEPLHVEREATRAELAKARWLLEERLNAVTQEADALVGAE
jgi:lysophospholipid acyltransferase (LPLAT)-like uncharacterized protein